MAEGRYQISDQGRIRCMPRYVKCRGGYVRRLPMKVPELKYDEVIQIKRMLAGGVHPYEIAEKMGISREMVSKIKSGRSYAWLQEKGIEADSLAKAAVEEFVANSEGEVSEMMKLRPAACTCDFYAYIVQK